MHPLEQKVESIRRRAGRVRLLFAIGWLAATLLASGLILGLADFVLRSEELGVRLLFSAALIGAVGWAVWKFLLPAIGDQSTIVQVAQRIEQRWPRLQDRLSSSLEFLAQERDDATAGSPALRRTVVAEATAQIDGLPLEQVVDRTRPRPVLITAGVLLAVVVLLSLAAPSVAARAARRLAMPWTTDDAWPRRNVLAFVDPPTRVPYGEPFRVELFDENGQPPELVEIYYWFEGQELADVQPQPMKPSGEQMVHQLGRVTRAFQYRAVGGDDDTMDWHQVEVVEPPRIAELKITLHPPAYTRFPAVESSRHIQAINGTLVTLHGNATKSIVSARIHVETEEGESDIPLMVGDDGTSFRLNGDSAYWKLATSGTYRLLLAGEEGVESGLNDRYQLNVAPDTPPRISVDAPEANTVATATAQVPVTATIHDDLAIARVELRFARSDRTEEGAQTIVLYEGDVGQDVVSARNPDGESISVQHTLDLQALGPFPPGVALAVSIAATDFRPQTEQSPPRRISIITPDQLEDRVVQRQTFLLGQLAEALAVQRECRLQSGAMQIQWNETGTISPNDVVDLQSAELNQRRVDRLLAGESDGVLTQIDALLEVARQNRLDNPELLRRIVELGKAVRLLTTNQLPAISRDLLTALKAAQSAMDQSNEKPVQGSAVTAVKTSVDSATATQDVVIKRLEDLLGDLSQWNSYRQFSRQVSSLRRDQAQVAEQTSELQARTLSKSLQQLSPQDRADLAKLGQRQSELARRLEQMLTDMEQMRDELTDDPVAAQTLADAVELARSEGVSGRMRQTSGQIEQNQLGQAAQSQDQLGEQLDELLDTLTGRREHQLQRRLEQMREAAGELQGLRDKAAQLGEQTTSALQNPSEAQKRRELQRLEAEREQLRQQAERLARKLERLRAEDAAQSLQQASGHAQQSGESAEQGDQERANRESDLAEEDLANAQQQLEQQIKQAEQNLLDEQLARLEQALKGMVDQQRAIHDETVRLDDLQMENGTLTRGQLASLRTLAQQQRGLIAESGAFAEQIAAAEVFHLGLTSAMREMATAANRLDAANPGTETQQAELRALTRLTQLVEAMQEDESDEPGDENSGSGSGGNQGAPPDGIQNIAQLKLLKLMQQSLQDRTASLEDIRQGRDWTADEKAEVTQLALEQGQLAELLLKLSEPADEAPEDDPESLPDLDGDLDRELENVLDEFKIEPEISPPQETP